MQVLREDLHSSGKCPALAGLLSGVQEANAENAGRPSLSGQMHGTGQNIARIVEKSADMTQEHKTER